jgi:hypothetical protein
MPSHLFISSSFLSWTVRKNPLATGFTHGNETALGVKPLFLGTLVKETGQLLSLFAQGTAKLVNVLKDIYQAPTRWGYSCELHIQVLAHSVPGDQADL